jgi:hypothetical protein
MQRLFAGLTLTILVSGGLLLAWQDRAQPAAAASTRTIVHNRRPLAGNAFYPLPLGAVKPRGWLRAQLQIQADGLGGHLDEFWPDLGDNSGWLGGAGESWERGPYFLDGLVPLAYLLDDARLIAKAKRWVEWTVTHQRADGAIGPPKNTDWWPNMVMVKVLTQYQEATGDPRVIPLLTHYFAHHLAELQKAPLKEWAMYRWQDEVLGIVWLYNRTGDAALLELARGLQKQGFDWAGQFENFNYCGKVTKADAKLNTHVVNNAMALKTSAVWSLLSDRSADRAAVYRQFETMDRCHLMPSGVHSGDEHYAGRHPSQGTELCAVVEGMFSIEQVLAILGDPAFGDRLEQVAFNALPGTFSADMWAHQYDQQPNQVLCSLRPRQWTSNGNESNLFGLEPNFGCCTANFHQGWPKLVSSLWMRTPDGGLAVSAYGPSEVRTQVTNGGARPGATGATDITIVEDTEYPFRDTINLTVTPARDTAFPLLLRIPAWTERATIAVNGEAVSDAIKPGTFFRLERTWKAGDRVALTFPMPIRTTRWVNDAVALSRGPLVFSLKMGEDWRELTPSTDGRPGMKNPAVPPAKDWEVHPTTPWNYALLLDMAQLSRSIEVKERPIGASPFSPTGAPIELLVRGRRVPEWTMVEGSAGDPPASPVASREAIEPLTLIPYGAAKLRVTVFPLAAPDVR